MTTTNMNPKGFTQHHFSTSGSHGSSLVPSKKSGAGFTLIELLVVISIIGFISVVALVNLNSVREKAKVAQGLATTRAVATKLTECHLGGHKIVSRISSSPFTVHYCGDGTPTLSPNLPSINSPLCDDAINGTTVLPNAQVWPQLGEPWNYAYDFFPTALWGCHANSDSGDFDFTILRGSVGLNCRITCTQTGCKVLGSTCP